MSGLSVALSNALSGLNVNQQAMATLSQNIANVNTPGYSRQIANQSAIYLDGAGAGVSIESITRKVDEYILRAVRSQNASVGQTSAISDLADRIQLLLGKPGENNSIDSAVTSFFSALQSLASTPQDTTLRQTAVNSGVNLALQIQQLASGLQDLQLQADQNIGSAVGTINNLLRNIQDLNGQINNSAALGKSVAGLEDQRDGLVKELSGYIDIHTYTRDNGAMNISTNSGASLLDDSLYRLSYVPAASAAFFSSGLPLQSLRIERLDTTGRVIGSPVTLATSDVPAEVTTTLSGGSLSGWLDMRDNQLPDIISQLDMLASTLRDQVNALHNAGTPYPGAASYTGTRLLSAQDLTQWSGSARIALLDANGQPVTSPYNDESFGVTPMTLDLGTLNGGFGSGSPTVQSIINAINDYYSIPQNKIELGDLNNIQLVSNSPSLPPAQLSFDFDLNNLSANNANFFVTGVQVKDSTGADITSVVSTIPSVALDASNTYITTAGSGVVTINTATAHGLSDGDVVYLSTPPGPVDGLPASTLGGFFRVSNVTGSSFDITIVGNTATAGMTTGVPGQTALPPYVEATAGATTRANSQGQITADLTANINSSYYDMIVDVAVQNSDGSISTSQVTYRVGNHQTNLRNQHYDARSATGDGLLVAPLTATGPLVRAMLVDADGNELPKTNGIYTNSEQGYLKIEAVGSNRFIAIDSLNSQEAGSGRGFSHYFDLNDFFQSNQPSATGDRVTNSALNLQVEQRLRDNPSLISLGSLTRGQNSISASMPPNYTYVRNIGDNSIVTRLGGLGLDTIEFGAAGGMSVTSRSFSGYISQIIGAAATNGANATANQKNAQLLMDGFTQRAASVSGVNLDNELANTVIYQNAYTASARVITVTNSLFDELLNVFG